MRTERGLTPAAAATVVVAAASLNVLVSACVGFGSETGPTGPSRSEVQRFNVTITASGVSPTIVKVPICRSSTCDVFLQFINSDSVPHDVRSDPHPAHTEPSMPR